MAEINEAFRKAADIEDACGGISVGGLAVELELMGNQAAENVDTGIDADMESEIENANPMGWHVLRGGPDEMDGILVDSRDGMAIAFVKDKKWTDAIATIPEIIRYLDLLVLLMSQMPPPELGAINWPYLREQGMEIVERMKGGMVSQREVAG